MKINRISIYKVGLPYIDGEYRWGAGNVLTVAASTIVVIDTDSGISGCGEYCPCGENYMVAHSEGVEALARLVAPVLMGEDPRQVARIERKMDSVVRGHGYAKSPFDAACWDILGKFVGQPVWMLLGGKLTDGAPMYRVAPQGEYEEVRQQLENHRAAGYRNFQIKVGDNWQADVDRIRGSVDWLKPGEKVFADANQGWRVDEAIRVANATSDIDYILEQPCESFRECMQVRRIARQPMKLDECITGIDVAHKIVQERGAEICCLKISNLGGLSKARRVRDYLVDHRLSVVAEDTWGGEITTAAVSHFAASTPSEYIVCTTDLHNYNTLTTGFPGPETRDGMLFASDEPGLGVEPDFESLGDPVAVFSV